jgi:L-fucose mutarotase/ribose pyranase (RbsD/FucU family)
MRYSITLFGLFLLMSVSNSRSQPWQAKLHRELPLLGHRNWIVIADSAYPLQTAAGIETIYADADQLEVLAAVLQAVSKTHHVKPIVYTDAELKHVPENRAPGVNAYREALGKLLPSQGVFELPHEEIISKLDQAGKTFKVFLIKTRLTIPYTSVFLQLDCAYWNSDSEQELRAKMKTQPK